MTEENLIRWTARMAVACYVMRLMYDVYGISLPSRQQPARLWWTLGCAWFTVHVITAFHFQYHWNHAMAWEYTARRTAELTGWKSGIGLWINEAFLGLWLIDTIVWWRHPLRGPTGWWYWSVQAVFAFLMFQSTVVFGPPLWTPIALVVIVLLFVGVFQNQRRSKITIPDGHSAEP